MIEFVLVQIGYRSRRYELVIYKKYLPTAHEVSYYRLAACAYAAAAASLMRDSIRLGKVGPHSHCAGAMRHEL